VAVPPAAVTSQLKPFTATRRLKWATIGAVQPRKLIGYAFSSAISTGSDSPVEYGPHWDGFAKRVALRMSTGATGRALEAGVGSLWEEDPRFVRTSGKPLKLRLLNVVEMSFMAHNRDGKLVPAYARYIAVPANSFLSNAWRPDSQTDLPRTLFRIPLTFIDRLISNTFSEFWPEISSPLNKVRHNKGPGGGQCDICD
jgi:hypothetical protein